MFDRIKKYLLSQLDKTTAWIGMIGLLLQALHMQSFLFILFIALIVMKQDSFSDIFKKWTGEIRDIAKE